MDQLGATDTSLSGIIDALAGLDDVLLLPSLFDDIDDAHAQISGPQASTSDTLHLTVSSSSGDALEDCIPPQQDATAGSAGSKKSKRSRQSNSGSKQMPGGHVTKQQLAELEAQLQRKQEQLASLTAENQYLVSRERIMRLVVSCRGDQVLRLQMVQNGDPSLLDRKILGTSMREVQHMKVDTAVSKYKEILGEVSGLLVAASAAQIPGTVDEEANAAMQKLHVFINEVLEACKFLFLLNPELLLMSHKHVKTNSNGEPVADITEAHWDKVACHMGLSPAQQSDLTILYTLYSSWVGEVLAARQHISKQLEQASNYVGTDGKAFALCCNSNNLNQDELMNKLQQNVVKESCLVTLMTEVMYHHILTPIQVARMFFESYPVIADEVAILHAIAKVSGISFRPALPAPAPAAAPAPAVAPAAAGLQ